MKTGGRRPDADGVRAEVERALDGIPADFGGGCSVAKGTLLALLALQRGLPSLEIGVYRGRSLLPQAVAQARLGGVAYGIDPYSREEALQRDRPDMWEALEAWRSALDPDALHAQLEGHIGRLRLRDACRLVRLPSRDARPLVESEGPWGLVHIDGNHDERNVRLDLALTCRHVAPGGWLVLDDASWPSVGRAIAAGVPPRFELVHRETRSEDYAVYWKRAPLRRAARARAYCAWAAEAAAGSTRTATAPASTAGPMAASR